MALNVARKSRYIWILERLGWKEHLLGAVVDPDVLDFFQVISVNVWVQEVDAGKGLGAVGARKADLVFIVSRMFLDFMAFQPLEVPEVHVTLITGHPILPNIGHVISDTVLVQVQHVLVGTAAIAAGKFP